MRKAIYDKRDWVLCICNLCGILNYVEPHGTTAACTYCRKDTEHSNIPQQFRDVSGTRLVVRPTRDYEFVWSPEGRTLITIRASTLRQAKIQFSRKCPSQAKYMREVYWNIIQ